MFEDKMLSCKDCTNEFILTAGEQEWYAQKGFTEPVRCPSCRKARKMSNNQSGDNYGKRYK